MNNNAWFKKEKPLLSLQSMGGGAASTLMSGVATKTYAEDVFNTYIYQGNNTSNTVNTGINYSEEGGLLWIKARNSARQHLLFDTVRGANKKITTNENWSEYDGTGAYNQTFTTTGFTLDNSYTDINDINVNYSSWNFRKQKGFFDIVTWTQSGSDGTARTLDHNLGCVPGFIMLKQTTGTENWICWHRDLGTDEALKLNGTDAAFGDNNSSVNSVSSTQFIVGADNNKVGSYVAYLFGGGESPAATARSVDFSGSNEYLSIPDSDDWDIGSSDCTMEAWCYFDSHGSHDGILHNVTDSGWTNGSWVFEPVSGVLNFYYQNTLGGIYNVQGAAIPTKQWTHLAITKTSGNVVTIWQDGLKTGSGTLTGTIADGSNPLRVAGHCVGADMDGKLSNVRFTKGQVLYTTAFTPSREPFTTTSQGATGTNVKLLCCNNSSVTGSTITPGTITNTGSTASAKSPYDDPEGFKFGADADQEMIRCGKITTDTSNGATLRLPWEPQWFLFKRTDSSSAWTILDSMRGWTENGTVEMLYPNTSGAESGGGGYEELKARTILFQGYGNNYDFVYVAIRRPDGYVGKPVETGTDALFINTLADADDPSIRSSTFPADFGIAKTTAISNSWNACTRLMQGTGLVFDTTAAAASNSNWQFDYMNGANEYNNPSVAQIGYLLKRHKGFDVVNYTGDAVDGRWLNHSLNAVPEMIWIKRTDTTGQWVVGHKGLDGGTAPWTHYLTLETTDIEYDYPLFYDTQPSSTTFAVNGHQEVNGNGNEFTAMLFASVSGISKVGSYDGSNSTNTITTGFQPRFVIIKRCSGGTGSWYVLDTVRGWGSGDDKELKLNMPNAQQDYDIGAPTSTGFTLTVDSAWNASGNTYVYYAHA